MGKANVVIDEYRLIQVVLNRKIVRCNRNGPWKTASLIRSFYLKFFCNLDCGGEGTVYIVERFVTSVHLFPRRSRLKKISRQSIHDRLRRPRRQVRMT